MKKRVLILGSNGYLASHLCKYLKQNTNHFLIGISKGAIRNTYVDKYLSLDLSQNIDIKQILNFEFDLVFDFISYIQPNEHHLTIPQIEKRLKNFYLLVTTIFIDKPIIFISSAGTIYGNTLKTCSEEFPTKGLTPYSKQKILQEEFLLGYHPYTTILRVTNPYGENQIVKHGVGFIARALYCIKTGEPLILSVPLQTSRNYIYINDVISTFHFFMNSNQHEKIYNIASHTSLSLGDVIQKIEFFTQKNMNIELTINNFDETKYIKHNIVSNKKLSTLIDTEKFYSFDEFMTQYISKHYH